MGRPKKIKQLEEAKPTYEVNLVMSGATHKTYGDTVLECLEQLKPEVIKSRGILIAKKDGRESKMILQPMIIRKLLVNSTLRLIYDKRLSQYMV